MAWPPRQHRRSSGSRRERNLALLRSFVTVGVIGAGLLLLVGHSETPSQGGIRGAALDGVAPIWTVARMPVDAIGRFGKTIDDYFFAISRSQQLEIENQRLRRLAERTAALERENAQLKRLLRVAEPKRGWSRSFPISGASSGSYVRSAIIGGGQAEGVRIGQPVRSAEGLVGRVVELGRHAARVLLITDINSRVPVRSVRTGKPAMVVGVNSAQLEVRLLATDDVQLQVGDRLVTSGDGGIFPPDIPVAVITRANGDASLARPLANLVGLGFVTVEQPYLPPLTPIAPITGAPQ